MVCDVCEPYWREEASVLSESILKNELVGH